MAPFEKGVLADTGSQQGTQGLPVIPEGSPGVLGGGDELRAADDAKKEFEGEDILDLQDLDPALNLKMHLVNNAINEIGWTTYHWKLFVLNGFGYAVDSLVLLLQSNVAKPAYSEFGGSRAGYSAGLNVAVYVGMLAGALFWGFGADMIGRRWAFNITLFVCSVATLVAGAAPNWPTLGFFVAMIGFGAGGNLILDTTVFLEYLPSNKQWALTFLACWWGVGQAVVGFICWGFLSKSEWNCTPESGNCIMANNWGWRYVMFTSGSLVLAMSLLRVTVVRLRETPKYLLGVREEARLVEDLQELARRYGRPCSLTVEKLEACGSIRGVYNVPFSPSEAWVHLSGLFADRRMSISTVMVWFSWTLIGLAYPLFYIFLTPYLASRGAYTGVGTSESWRNYTLTNISGIFGPVLAAWLCNLAVLGRRRTMAIGALATMALFFGYTTVTRPSQDVGFSCAIAFAINVYYGCLYAYTPEVLPSAHRATGNGVAVACNRLMGVLSSVVATETNVGTPAPIYVCAALYAVMAIVAVLFPFEPYGRRSS